MDLASMITPNPEDTPQTSAPTAPLPPVALPPSQPVSPPQATANPSNEFTSLNRTAFCQRCKAAVPYDQMASIVPTQNDKKIILPLPGDIHFQIESCPACSPDHGMRLQLLPRDWTEILHVTLASLRHLAPNQEFSFHFQEHIQPFISTQWERLCIGQSSDNWWEQAEQAMHNNPEQFGKRCTPAGEILWFSKRPEEKNQGPSELYVRRDPESAEMQNAGAVKRPRSPSHATEITQQPPAAPASVEVKTEQPLGTVPVQQPMFLPFIRRYYSPTEKIPLTMHLEAANSAPQMTIERQGLGCYNSSGYRMARGSYPIQKAGIYYYEVFLPPTLVGGVRVGWSTEKGELQGPVGYDRFSFSLRSKTGEIFHRARGKPYGEPYGAGDTIGILMKTTDTTEERQIEKLKETTFQNKKDPKWAKPVPIFPKKDDKDTAQEIMIGSYIQFFKNGVSPGIAFADIPSGNYYPAVSLYLGARCTLEFGPNFRFPVSLPHEVANGNEISPLCSVVPSEHPPPKPEPSFSMQPAMVPAVVTGLNPVPAPTEPTTGPAPVKVTVKVLPEANTLHPAPAPPGVLPSDPLHFVNR